MFRTLASAMVLSLFAGAASAATVTFSATPTVVSLNPTPASVTGEFYDNVTYSVGGVRISPFAGTAGHRTLAYSSIYGTVSYAFGSDRTTLQFIWGTPDAYNSLNFYNDGVLVDTLAGTGAGGNLVEALALVRTEGAFDTVEFVSTRRSFEYANVVAAVPLPASGVMLLGALAGVLGLRRRAKAA